VRRIVFEPLNHLLMALCWIVDGITYPIELAHMTAILGYGSDQPQQQQ
jgi:hypothetical protein